MTTTGTIGTWASVGTSVAATAAMAAVEVERVAKSSGANAAEGRNGEEVGFVLNFWNQREAPSVNAGEVSMMALSVKPVPSVRGKITAATATTSSFSSPGETAAITSAVAAITTAADDDKDAEEDADEVEESTNVVVAGLAEEFNFEGRMKAADKDGDVAAGVAEGADMASVGK